MQVIGGRAHWLFGADDLPEWNDEDCDAVDVTDMMPAPVVGDLYVRGEFRPDLAKQQAVSADEKLATDKAQVLVTSPEAKALLSMTPDQIDAWIDAQVIDLPSARSALKIIAKIVSVTLRHEI